jgi:hypothetical protein
MNECRSEAISASPWSNEFGDVSGELLPLKQAGCRSWTGPSSKAILMAAVSAQDAQPTAASRYPHMGRILNPVQAAH